MITTESYNFEHARSLTKPIPDVTTEKVADNSICYLAHPNKDIKIGLIYACKDISTAQESIYQCSPITLAAQLGISPVIGSLVTPFNPLSSISIIPTPKDEAPSFKLTLPIKRPVHSNSVLAHVEIQFEAITPMDTEIKFEVSESFRKEIGIVLLPFGSPFPTAVAQQWVLRNWAEIKISEKFSVAGNNQCAISLGESFIFENMVMEYFEKIGSLCQLRNNVVAGQRKYSYSLANSAIYARTIRISI